MKKNIQFKSMCASTVCLWYLHKAEVDGFKRGVKQKRSVRTALNVFTTE